MIAGPFLGLAAAGHYCGRPRTDAAAARWARRRLIGNVPHVRIPGSGIVFAQRDLDAFMRRHRVEALPEPIAPPAADVLDLVLPRRVRGAGR